MDESSAVTTIASVQSSRFVVQRKRVEESQGWLLRHSQNGLLDVRVLHIYLEILLVSKKKQQYKSKQLQHMPYE